VNVEHSTFMYSSVNGSMLQLTFLHIMYFRFQFQSFLCERVFMIVYQLWGYVDMNGESVYLGGNYCTLFQMIFMQWLKKTVYTQG